jgi:aryl-alcohol dehydrogenase-like predicted oxidoreductase
VCQLFLLIDSLLRSAPRSVRRRAYAKSATERGKPSLENHLPPYQVLQPEYNLYNRSTYDGSLRELCINKDLGVVTY